MPNKNESGTQNEGQTKVGQSKMSAADALAMIPGEERDGETESAGTTQSKTTDEVDNTDDEEVEGVDDTDDDDQEESEEESESEEDEEGNEDEEDDDGSDSDQEQDGDEVELPEPIQQIVNKLAESDPDAAKELQAHARDTEKLVKTANDSIKANAGFVGVIEALIDPETAPAALEKSLELIAGERGMSVTDMMLNAGWSRAAQGGGEVPAFLEESNHAALIDELLKGANLEEGAQLEDAKLGAELAIKHLLERRGELLPADYGEYQEYLKAKEQKKVQTEAQAEAQRVVKSNFAAVASRIARNYDGYKATEDQMLEAVMAFPQLLKDKTPEEVYLAVVAKFEPKLRGFMVKKKTKRAKKQMPVMPSGGEHKPQGVKKSAIGNRGMGVRDAVPR